MASKRGGFDCRPLPSSRASAFGVEEGGGVKDRRIQCWVIRGPSGVVQDGSLSVREPEDAWDVWLTVVEAYGDEETREELEGKGFRVVKAWIEIESEAK